MESRSALDSKGPMGTPDYGRIDSVRSRSYVWVPRSNEAMNVEETVPMADRIRRAWTFVMAVAPIAAIALVEGALRRWS